MRDYEGVSIDVGTGDGRAVLDAARRDPSRLAIGIDASRDGLIAGSQHARRKPARGGAPNALFVHAPAEQLPAELAGIADRLGVLLPWGSLLGALLRPDADVLRDMRALCRPAATLDVVVSLDVERDGGAFRRLGLEAGEAVLDAGRLREPYAVAGFEGLHVTALEREELAALPSTWARKLARGQDRQAWRLTATASDYAAAEDEACASTSSR